MPRKRSKLPSAPSFHVLIYVSGGDAPVGERNARMDAKVAWLSGHALKNNMSVHEVVRETDDRFQPGSFLYSALAKHSGVKGVLCDSFDGPTALKWGTGFDIAVLEVALPDETAVIQPRRTFIEGQRVVTLIHGTFCPNAPWTQLDSEFSNWLREHLAGVIVRRFQWTGKNHPRGRTLAALELLLDLEKVADLFPGHEHYLVAHSHGGSVALECLKYVESKPYLAGLVCLNTPLLTYGIRDVTPLLSLAVGGLAVVACMFAASVYPLVGLVFALFLLAIADANFFGGLKRDAESWIRLLKIEAPTVPILWVRNQDQMPPYLRTVAAVTALPARGWQVAFGVTVLLSKVGLLIVALMALIGMVVFAVTGNIPQIPGAGALVGFAEALHVTAIGGVMVSPFVVPVVLFAILIRRWLAFGSVGLADLFISVKVSADAPSEFQCDTVTVVDLKGFWHRVLHLQHSRLYQNAEVAEKIAEWMATKSKPADSGAPDSFSVYE